MKQETPKADKMSAKAVTVSGTVGADGTTFIDKDNKTWTVTNPEALKGHEPHVSSVTQCSLRRPILPTMHASSARNHVG